MRELWNCARCLKKIPMMRRPPKPCTLPSRTPELKNRQDRTPSTGTLSSEPPEYASLLTRYRLAILHGWPQNPGDYRLVSNQEVGFYPPRVWSLPCGTIAVGAHSKPR